jgi:hypothetical protein
MPQGGRSPGGGGIGGPPRARVAAIKAAHSVEETCQLRSELAVLPRQHERVNRHVPAVVVDCQLEPFREQRL